MFKPYTYEKRTNLNIKRPARAKVVPVNPSKYSLLFKVTLSSLLILSGMYIMFSKVLIPAVAIYASSGEAQPIISPVVDKDEQVLSVSHKGEVFTFDELKRESFGGENGGEADIPDHFYLTIPKLDIFDAKIDTNSNNFDPAEALGHYDGSCLPNEACNTFIFGHSTYKWAKNRYDEGDYNAVFSRLEELEYGDEFHISYDGETYDYIVDLTRVAAPEEINPLESPYPRSLGKHESTVELFTCTPSGTTKYRLSVIGKLVK